jgi:hypothetical protein
VFGTFDKKDGGFGQVEDGNGSLNKEKKDDEKFEKGVGILDENFSKGLPPPQLFDDMTKLVSFVEKKEKPQTLTPEEQAEVELKSVVSRAEISLGWQKGMNSQNIANANAIAAHQQLCSGGFNSAPVS